MHRAGLQPKLREAKVGAFVFSCAVCGGLQKALAFKPVGGHVWHATIIQVAQVRLDMTNSLLFKVNMCGTDASVRG